MGKNLPATYRLTDQYLMVSAMAEANPDNQKLQDRREELQGQLMQKYQNIRYVKDRFKANIAKLKAEKKFYLDQKRKMNDKIKKYERAFDRLEDLAIQIIETAGEANDSGNYYLETDLGKFTAVEYARSVKVEKPDLIPEQFKEKVVTEKVDKRELLKYIKRTGTEKEDCFEIPGAKLLKKVRLNIS